jgi:hypothetical protein
MVFAALGVVVTSLYQVVGNFFFSFCAFLVDFVNFEAVTQGLETTSIETTDMRRKRN